MSFIINLYLILLISMQTFDVMGLIFSPSEPNKAHFIREINIIMVSDLLRPQKQYATFSVLTISNGQFIVLWRQRKICVIIKICAYGTVYITDISFGLVHASQKSVWHLSLWPHSYIIVTFFLLVTIIIEHIFEIIF